MRIAILLRGISYHPNYKHHSTWNINIDYRFSFQSYIENVCVALSSVHHVDVFLITYHSDIGINLLEDYQPKAYKFVDMTNYNQIKLLVHGIQLLLEYNVDSNYDFVLITRFDLIYRVPLEQILNFTSFNVCFREQSYKNAVSDIMYAFPSHMTKPFLNIIENCKWLHGIQPELESTFGNIHFMTNKIHTSNAINDQNYNPIFHIVRRFVPQNISKELAESIITKHYNTYLCRDPMKIEVEFYTNQLLKDKMTPDLMRIEILSLAEKEQKHLNIIQEHDQLCIELLGLKIHDIERAYNIEGLIENTTTLADIQKRLYKHPMFETRFQSHISVILQRFPTYINSPHELYNLAKALKENVIPPEFFA